MNTTNTFENGTFWNFWTPSAEPLCRLLLLIKIFDHTKVSWQYDVRCFFFMVYHCCPGIQRISACVTRINERSLNLINWIQILADIVLVEKMCQIQKNIQKKNITIDHYSFQISTPIKFLRKFLLNITYLDCSTTFLTSDDFIRSNEIVRTKWTIH